MKPATLLRATGPMIHGPGWHAPLARDLGIATRTIQRWETGEREAPETLVADLRALLIKHRDKINDLIASAKV
jgi:hypothetical protein